MSSLLNSFRNSYFLHLSIIEISEVSSSPLLLIPNLINAFNSINLELLIH